MKLEWICHVAIGFEVLGSANNPNSTLTELLDDAMMRYGCAYHGSNLHVATGRCRFGTQNPRARIRRYLGAADKVVKS